MDEEDIDMGVEDVDVEGPTLSLSCSSTFIRAEAIQRFQRTLMRTRSHYIHPCC